MLFVNFKKKFAFFPSIFARISMFEHFRGDVAYAEPNFFLEISLHAEHTRNEFPRMLTQR
jgi:hypothetical protein